MSTRQKLISNLTAKNHDLSKGDIHDVIVNCFDYITLQLTKGNRVEIRGFGVFEPRRRNVVSSLGKTVMSQKNTVHYKASKTILRHPGIIIA